VAIEKVIACSLCALGSKSSSTKVQFRRLFRVRVGFGGCSTVSFFKSLKYYAATKNKKKLPAEAAGDFLFI